MFHITIRIIQIYETLPLKAMTGQSKIMQIICLGILSMFLYLEKYLSQEIQATRFEILKTLICGRLNTVSCTVLQVESNLGTSPH